MLGQDLTAVDVSFVASCASAFGALFIIFNWLCNPLARRLFFLRLIVFLSIANLLSSASYIMSFVEWRLLARGGRDDDFSRTWCLVQAMLMVVFENVRCTETDPMCTPHSLAVALRLSMPSSSRAQASVVWTVAIALALHQQVVRRAAAERHERYYHLAAWGLPLVIALTLLLCHRLGPADEPREVWCWIASNSGPANQTSNGSVTTAEGALEVEERGARSHHVPFISGGGSDSRYVQLLVFYLPLLLAFAFNLGTYLRVGSAFRRMARDGSVDASKERMIQLRLRLYLLVFLIVWALPLAHRTLELFGIDPEWLRIAHTATQCSMVSESVGVGSIPPVC